MRNLPYIALGFISMLLQVTVLRELLTVFSGNELDIGITLALWLLFVGTGSFAGARAGRAGLLAPAFITVSLLASPTLMGIAFIKPVLGLGLGETAPLGATFLSTAAVLLPICFVLGAAFPMAVAHCRERLPETGDPTSRVYGLEAAGAFLGGVLFTFILAGRVGAEFLVLATAIACVLIALMLLRKMIFVTLLIVPMALHLALVMYSLPKVEGASPFKTSAIYQSRYGEIRITELGGQLNVYTSGHLAFSYPNPQAEEMAVHLPMSLNPGARRVLFIGGSPGMVREYLKYPLERLDFVEADPALLDASLRIATHKDRVALESPSVNMVAMDGRRFIQGIQKKKGYDLIALNLPPPATANLNRFYTMDFFWMLRDVMSQDGVLVLRLPTSGGYVGRRMMRANGSVYRSLNEVFPHVGVSTEEYGVLYASNRPVMADPDGLKTRFAGMNVPVRYFGLYVLDDAFSRDRVSLHARRLMKVDETNTDTRPAAYLYNLMLWAEVYGGGVLSKVLGARPGSVAVAAGMAFALIGTGVFRRRRATVYYSVFSTGYASMGMSVAIILGYQAELGFVYERIGLLSATFMAGMAIGALGLRRAGFGVLALLEIAAASFAFIAPSLFGPECVFYALSTMAGALTGALFAAASSARREMEGVPTGEGGMLYALDLGGSFFGAALVAVLFIPLMGVRGTLALIAGLKVLSALLVLAAGGRLFERLGGMVRIRWAMAMVIALSLAASLSLKGEEQRVDESLYLAEVYPATMFGEKGGIPLHYQGGDGTLAYNSYDVTPGIRGYAGPIKLLLALSPDGVIQGIRILEHKETPNYVRGMERQEFLSQFLGKHVREPFELGRDIDGVSRATVSVEALAETVRASSRTIANEDLGLDVTIAGRQGRGGITWAVLLVYMAFALGVYAYTRRGMSLASKKRLRDAVMVLSILVIGLWLSSPISVIHFLHVLLLRVSSAPSWLVLVAGVSVSMALAGRFYCGWLCPFGALSELVGRLPGRKWEVSFEMDSRWRKLKYAVLAVVIVAVMVSGNTSYGNFEPYVTIFSFYGNVFAWAVAAVALLASLRVRRFWCRYLCPVGAITGMCSPKDTAYVSIESCPMDNPRRPHTSECIRCNYCYSSVQRKRDGQTGPNEL